MSTKAKTAKTSAAEPALLTMQELGALILEHQGIREGLFDVKIEFQLATGGVGPNPIQLLPGIIIGISKIGLAPSDKPNASTLDASKLSKSRKKTAAR